ncbi:MAG: DNA polymerase III subunit alpha [Clostridia bacterium]|nr:DNA polymerase III subunit alpha [Clostridia bacterium]
MFTHLHVHTEYSLLDGACRIKELVQQAKHLGQKALAITDHGVMYGAVDFFGACQEAGIKPIIGCEIYVAKRTRFDKVKGMDEQRHHLVLLCKNEQGYKNLIKIVSRAWTQGFYTKPRADKQLLEEYHEGLIALSACLAGEIPRLLAAGDFAAAKESALWYERVFGKGNYYLELQDHALEEQRRINPLLLRLSEQTGIPLVATNDVHYIQKEDAFVQNVLLCIQTNHVLGEDTGIGFETEEFYLKSEAQMRELFPPEAIENTEKIADACNFSFEFGNTVLPNFEVPARFETHYDYFRYLCEKGLEKRYGENPPAAYRERMEYELGVIRKMGYVDYYLIVWDYIRFARSKGIAVGPGRGSGAGSICAYVIGITQLDPMKYGLIFERFLNPERISMPDFDVDFCYVRRQEVIDYVIDKYGVDFVAQIVTFGTMAARGSVRDVGRVMGLPYAQVDKIAKLIPRAFHITLSQALTVGKELKAAYESDETVGKVIDTALKIEGMPRNCSTHAAGVVITKNPVDTYVPLSKNDDAIVTQYTMTALERLGLLKMDFLGLRTLTVISDAEKMIQQREPDFKADAIPLDDKQVYRLFSEGKTDGVFQFESAGMKQMLIGLQPESLEDIIASISLYRPGPAKSIPTYTQNRHNPALVRYQTPALKPILSVTYGCMVYQEQVMEVFRELAGYSFGRADLVRRAMSKKKADVMAKERQYFVYGKPDEGIDGAVKRGVPETIANEIFDDMSAFSQYAFNKSHAACYAYVAYQTAYLKVHYPCEFMAALLTSVLDDFNKISIYISECNRLGIRILPPSVNESAEYFTAGEKEIRFGLLAIKNLGLGIIGKIIAERQKGGKYTSFYDFLERIYEVYNRRAVESLILSGALDGLGANRREMLQAADLIMNRLSDEHKRNIEGQVGFFDYMGEETMEAFVMPQLHEFSTEQMLEHEKEVTGLYISGHPLLRLQKIAKLLGCVRISDVLTADESESALFHDGSEVKVMVIISKVTRKHLKNGTDMAFLTVEDSYGSAEIIVFAALYERYKAFLQEGKIIIVQGKISLREDEEPKILLNTLMPFEQEQYRDMQAKLYLRLPSAQSPQRTQAEDILAGSTGNCAVYYYYTDTATYENLKQPQGYVRFDSPEADKLEQLLGSENAVYRK